MKSLSNQKLVFSALCIALYIVVMMCTQSFAFGQYQIRIATALYGLSACNSVMGGLGLPDIICGFIVGIVTTGIIVLAKRRGCGNWIIWAAVTFVPGLGVPVWLSVLLDIPYLVLASSLLIGQCICGIASVMLVTALERVGAGKLFAFDGGKQ